MSGPVDRLRENLTSATALVIIGLGILAYAIGIPSAWVIFVIGLLVVVPLVGLLFGAEDWRKWDPLSDEFWEDAFGEESEDEVATSVDAGQTKTDALETLRSRYARGELTDEQFERKVELLVATESLEDVADLVDRDRELERERG